ATGPCSHGRQSSESRTSDAPSSTREELRNPSDQYRLEADVHDGDDAANEQGQDDDHHRQLPRLLYARPRDSTHLVHDSPVRRRERPDPGADSRNDAFLARLTSPRHVDGHATWFPCARGACCTADNTSSTRRARDACACSSW